MNKEDWKDVTGFEGFLKVSTGGKVIAYERTWESGRGLVRVRPEREAKIFIDRKGYQVFHIIKDKKRFNFKVHRLVSIAFIPNPENKPQVNHKNGIKIDNRVENLEWATPSENLFHAHRNGLKRTLKGEQSGRSKLKEADVIEIRKSTMTEHSLAAKYGVSRSAISFIKLNYTWKHLQPIH